MKTFSRKRVEPSGYGGASWAKPCQRSGARCSGQPSPVPRESAAPDIMVDATDPYGFACASSDDEDPPQRRKDGIVPPITAVLPSPPQLSPVDSSAHAAPHAPAVACSRVVLRDKQRSLQHSMPAERSYPGQRVTKSKTARQCEAAKVSTAAARSAAVGATEAVYGRATAANGVLASSSSDLGGFESGSAAAGADPFDFLLHADSSSDSEGELCAPAEPSARTSSSGQRAKTVPCADKPPAAKRQRQQAAPVGEAAAVGWGKEAGGPPAGRRSGSILSRQSSGQLGASLEQRPRLSGTAAWDSVSTLGTPTQSSDHVAPPGPERDVSVDPLALPPRPHAIRTSAAEAAPLPPLPPPTRQPAAGGGAATGAGASEPAHPRVLAFTRKGAPPVRKAPLEAPPAMQDTAPAFHLPTQTLPQPTFQQQQQQQHARQSASDSRQTAPVGLFGAPRKHRPAAFGDFASGTQRSSGGSQPAGGSQRSSGCGSTQSSPSKLVAPSMSLAQVLAPLRQTLNPGPGACRAPTNLPSVWAQPGAVRFMAHGGVSASLHLSPMVSR